MAPRPVKTVIASAPSKVNLILRVGAADRLGYHTLATVFEALSLREYAVAQLRERSPEGSPTVQTLVYQHDPGQEPRLDHQTTRRFSGMEPETHLAVRAAKALGADGQVNLVIHKTVPIAGGMAGGSADAAAALVAVNQLLELGHDISRLQQIGRQLGADVPACLVGGVSLGLGRGDQMELLSEGTRSPSPASDWWVTVFMDRGLSTPEVFQEFDRLTESEPTRPVASPSIEAGLLEPLREPGLRGPGIFVELLENQLQEPALNLRPELRLVGEILVSLGCDGWILSGSGPTVAGLASSEEEAVRIALAVNSNPPAGVRGASAVWGPAIGAQLERGLPGWVGRPV